MAVNLSPVGGVAAQFLDNNGNVLTGGKIYTYASGTTTPQASYTSAAGTTAHSNPIILDASGRVPGGEIWLTDGLQYKVAIYTADNVLIGTYDNVIGINSNFVNFVTAEEVQIATAGQTVFTLTTMQYTPSTNNLVVYVDGVNQVEGGSYSYVETNSTTVTFTAGLHVGAVVKFVSAEVLSTNVTDASTTVYTPAGSGAVQTNVQAKLRETVSVKDFGAVGDGVTDDTAAIQNAELNSPVYAPLGTYLTTVPKPTDLVGKQYGFGQIKTADGNKSAPNFSIINSAPTSQGSLNSIWTAFNGDLSKCLNASSVSISGAATLGQPTTGYKFTPEVSPYFTYVTNTSGHNESTSGNDGRTGFGAYYVKLDNYGQGDLGAYVAQAFVSGTKAGSTSFLANPAAGIYGGNVNAGSDGVYLNPAEWACSDNGYDVAAVGLVNSLFRYNNTGAKNVFWAGYRCSSNGTKPADSFLSAGGLFNNGLDVVTADFGANQCAISLKATQRMYFNNAATPTGGSGIAWVTNVYNNDYMEYRASLDTGIKTIVGGVDSFTVRSDAVAVTNTNGLIMRSTGVLRFEGVGQASTGATTPAFSASNKPGSTNGQGPATWLRIVAGGVEYLIPCWLP